MRREAHGGFGERPGETERRQRRHRAPGRLSVTAFCSNIGDSLAVMLRPGNAGSFTAADHLLVLDAAIGQIPAGWRTDLLVTIDGAGASHAVINHLTSLNTALIHGRRRPVG